MARPRVHDDAVRRRLLEVASEVIATDGVGALTVRDVARRAGTSTTAVYSLFGGRAELVAAVVDEGFRRFAEHLAAAPRGEDARTDLRALGLAYRASALDNPHFYRVMFDTPGAPGGDRPVTERATFAVLRDAVARVLRAADGPQEQATRVAGILWAHVHGLVSLELAGMLPWPAQEGAEAFERSLQAVGAAAFAGVGPA